MYFVFLALTILFGAVLVTGFTWTMIDRGQSNAMSSQEAGERGPDRAMEPETSEPGEIEVPLTSAETFHGAGAGVERQAEYRYQELARMIREGKLRLILPPLLTLAGVIGVTLFLGLTLLVSLTDKLWGVLLLVFSLYTLYLIVAGLRRKRQA